MPAGDTYAALLRGVNVGGANRLAMTDLRSVLESLGHEDVVTVLQSGNAVFRASSGRPELAPPIEAAIRERLGLAVRVIVRTPTELREAAAGNPFLAREADLSRLHVVFLDDAPTPESVATLDPERSPGDAFAVSGRVIFVHYRNGAARTKLSLDYFERRLGVTGTARNWRTLLRLIALTER